MKTKQEVQNMLEAIENARESMKALIPYIDDLNGRLEELTIHNESSDLSDDALEAMNDLYDFYIHLPVWDTIDTYIEKLNTIEADLNNNF